ncbi:hypothetical protein FQN57_000216 [Myotisia sp. PD_48]|nr:hypothetical protein FQN57_000216 [Myotisia sp. PD_48]
MQDSTSDVNYFQHQNASGRDTPYGHLSPINSNTNTPSNGSPTSPRLMNSQIHQVRSQSRQIRPPKSPLYVPAALRRTERPKPSPLTPPRSVHGSVDNLSTDNIDPAPLSRKSTVDSTNSGVSRLAEDEWLKDQNLGSVTGSPTRDHWKADSASPSCDSPVCKSFFGLFLRRHHCRHCGHVFCSSHTPHTIPLDQDARFHPQGTQSRSCELCWNAYRRWEDARADQLSQIEGGLLASAKSTRENGGNCWTANPPESDSVSIIDCIHPTQSLEHQNGPVASSVPRDWSWSTF